MTLGDVEPQRMELLGPGGGGVVALAASFTAHQRCTAGGRKKREERGGLHATTPRGRLDLRAAKIKRQVQR